MSISFNKMIHFTRLVKMDGRLREFNFRKNNNVGAYAFDVDTADDRGNRLFMRLMKEDNQWELSSKQDLPAWINSNKEQMIQELEEGLNEN